MPRPTGASSVAVRRRSAVCSRAGFPVEWMLYGVRETISIHIALRYAKEYVSYVLTYITVYGARSRRRRGNSP